MTVITIKFVQCGFNIVMHPKDPDRMAKSIDHWSDYSLGRGLIWVYTVCSDLSIQILRSNYCDTDFYTTISGSLVTNLKHIYEASSALPQGKAQILACSSITLKAIHLNIKETKTIKFRVATRQNHQ